MKKLLVVLLLFVALLPSVTQAPTPALAAQPAATREWLKTATMYSIFVRSFRDSNGDGIGDLQGVIQQLDYIQSLGVDTLYLLPVFKAASYHGYDTTDYYTVNPDYGTNDDLIQLAQELHQRGMYLILDYVLNHTSDQHPYFQDAFNNPDSEYSEYYEWSNDAHTEYKGFAGLGFMPTLNYDSPAVVQMALDIATYWMDPNKDGDFSDGIDGWRCDVALEIPHAYWKEMRLAMNALNPQAIILGELFTGDGQELRRYLQGDEMNAAFDFPSAFHLSGGFEVNGDGLLNGQSDVGILGTIIRAQMALYCPECGAVRFINNHDTNRVASDVNGDPARLRMAAVWLLTTPGPAVIYYGEEIGMQGSKGTGPIYDEYRREPFDWYASLTGEGMTSWFTDPRANNKADDGISVEEQDGNTDSLLTLYRTLGELRHSAVFVSGSADVPKIASPLFLTRRWNTDELLITLINFTTAPQSIAIDPAVFNPENEAFDLASMETVVSQGITTDAGMIAFEPAAYAIYRFTK